MDALLAVSMVSNSSTSKPAKDRFCFKATVIQQGFGQNGLHWVRVIIMNLTFPSSLISSTAIWKLKINKSKLNLKLFIKLKFRPGFGRRMERRTEECHHVGLFVFTEKNTSRQKRPEEEETMVFDFYAILLYPISFLIHFLFIYLPVGINIWNDCLLFCLI